MALKKLVIHEDVVERRHLSMAEMFACLLISECTTPEQVFTELENKRLIMKDSNDSYLLMLSTSKELQTILLDSKKELPNTKDLEEFYYKLADLFPKGIRPGTSSTYWRGNKRDTIRKLQAFIDEYGKYTQDEIYAATKHYVNQHKFDKTYMRTLPYFIGKYGESDLANVLENMDSESEGVASNNFDTGELI